MTEAAGSGPGGQPLGEGRPRSVACGPGSRPPSELSASSGSAGLLTASIFTCSPRSAATSAARSGRYCAGLLISAGCSPSGSSESARAASAPATVLAATIWVRIRGRYTTSPCRPQLISTSTNSWNWAARRIRAGTGPRGPLMRELGRPVAAGGPVGADDGHHHQSPDARLYAFFLQVPSGRGEELRRRGLLRRWPGGRVDDGVRTLQRGRQAVPGDHVHAVRARNRHHLVPALAEHVDDVPSDSSGGPRYRDPCHVTSPS